jgi:hypothetical protein
MPRSNFSQPPYSSSDFLPVIKNPVLSGCAVTSGTTTTLQNFRPPCCPHFSASDPNGDQADLAATCLLFEGGLSYLYPSSMVSLFQLSGGAR